MKKSSIIIIFMLMIAFVGSLLYSANTSHLSRISNNTFPTPSTIPATTTPEPTPRPDYTIKFDVTKSKVGDMVGKMKITNISGFKSSPPSNDRAVVTFSGKATLTGTIEHQEGGQMGETVCIYNLDEQSSAQIPRLLEQNGDVYVCFSNLEEAKTTLKDASRATITIDSYVLTWIPIEALSSAKLISVISVQ